MKKKKSGRPQINIITITCFIRMSAPPARIKEEEETKKEETSGKEKENEKLKNGRKKKER